MATPSATVRPSGDAVVTTTPLGEQRTSSPVTTAGSASTEGAGPAASGVYKFTGAGQLSPAVAEAKPYVYVPSNTDGTVTVIDQRTLQIVTTYRVGKLAQHVVADWDMRTLYATASGSNRLVPIDPATGNRVGTPIDVAAPYNLYFTPDGTHAVVMAERLRRIDYYDRTTWERQFSIDVSPCRGVNHADWSADGSWFLVTCEFSGSILKLSTVDGAILGRLDLPAGSMPQDIRIAPDGSKFYVADMQHGCLWVLSGDGSKITGQIVTGTGAHGIYPSRDGTRFYVSNRGRLDGDIARPSHDGEGSISVVDPVTDSVVGTWTIPGGGSPDMGGVSADGSQLWLSGRFDSEVYVFDTSTGTLTARIKVPPGPHGLNVFPQPGRYSLGHTENYR